MSLGRDIKESEYTNRKNNLVTSEHPEITIEMFLDGEIKK